MVLSTSVAGDLAASNGAGSIVPGGGEPSRGEADWYAPGILLADLTGDGRPDIYLPRYDNSETDLRGNLFYTNLGGGRFADATEASGAGSDRNSTCAVAGDADNDGDLDVFVANDLSPSQLFLNDGCGRFRDVAPELGLDFEARAFVASFADYDHDGRLDLYVGTWDAAGPNGHHGGAGSHVAPNLLFHQREDGTFEEVAEEAGVQCFGRSALATGFADVDGDGWVDLYVANDFFDDCFYINNRDGTFRDATEQYGAGPNAITGMGVTYGDADGDGDFDLYVADDLIPDGSTGNVFYRNDGGTFTSMAPALGLAGRFTWGTSFADFDDDGDLDLFGATILGQGPYLLYRNDGELRFTEIGGEAIGDFRDARGSAVGDVDGDGRLDLVVALRRDPIALFLNRSEGSGHYLRVALEGRRSNRSGAGAIVTVEAGGRRQVRTILLGDSYRSMSEPIAHFGLGTPALAERVEVRFAGGATVVREGVPADRTIVIVEPGE